MIPSLAFLVAVASAFGVYLLFFEGPKELAEQFVLHLAGGGGRDFRITLLFVVFLAGGLFAYLALLRMAGKPLSIPFL